MRSTTSPESLRLVGFAAIFCLALNPIETSAQPDSSLNKTVDQKKIFSVALGYQQATIFSYRTATSNTKGSYPKGVTMDIAWQKNDQASLDHCNCYPRIGLKLAYFDFDNPLLGHGFMAAHFLEPVYRMGRRNAFSFMGAIGMIHLSNPFDSITNIHNESYSTHFSPYLMLGIGVWFHLSDHWWLNGSALFQHASNGGIHRPNIGMNWPAVGIAVKYDKFPRAFFKGKRNKMHFWKGDSPRWDLAGFGMLKYAETKNSGSHWYPVLGTFFQGSKQISRHDAIVLGVEIIGDNALQKRLDRDNLDVSSMRVGVMIGHEFILNKVIFAQRIGIYLFDQTPYYPSTYSRWTIHYRLNEHWGLGFALLAHKAIADFIDLRVVYSWQKAKR